MSEYDHMCPWCDAFLSYDWDPVTCKACGKESRLDVFWGVDDEGEIHEDIIPVKEEP